MGYYDLWLDHPAYLFAGNVLTFWMHLEKNK
jgi:hypothetical protein